MGVHLGPKPNFYQLNNYKTALTALSCISKYCLGTSDLSRDSEDKWECAIILNKSGPLTHGSTNPRGQTARAIRFCTVVSNTYGSSVLNLLRFTLPESIILGWLLHIWEICGNPPPKQKKHKPKNFC